MSAALGPELVVGLVGAIGSNMSSVSHSLANALLAVNYTVEEIHVIDLLHSFPEWANTPHYPEEKRYEDHIAAGREFCKKLNREDGLVRLGVARIRESRVGFSNDFHKPYQRHAYVLRSLKRKAEVELLRYVYGSSFLLVAAHLPRQKRIDYLAKNFADSNHEFDPDRFRAKAEELVEIDEREGDAFGQNVGSTFPLADIFVSAKNNRDTTKSLERFVEILFGHPFHTPTPDEYGMMQARVASLRSADLSRQVGCAIANAAGDIVSLGCNDVPTCGGGLYWEGDSSDGRDFQRGRDASYEMRRRVLADALQRLHAMGWLEKTQAARGINELVEDALHGASGSLMRDSRLMDLIEFGRTVHAEMDAISTAARRGVSVGGCTLYSTTFPCHLCARHVVSSGISRVVYIEPYEKSVANELFNDSIVVDDPHSPSGFVNFEHFVGVSPNKYVELFQMKERKRRDGSALKWPKTSAVPRLSEHEVLYMHKENLLLKEFESELLSAGLSSFKQA